MLLAAVDSLIRLHKGVVLAIMDILVRLSEGFILRRLHESAKNKAVSSVLQPSASSLYLPVPYNLSGAAQAGCL